MKSAGEKDPSQPLPSYLLDRNNPQQAKELSSAIKNRRSEKSARYSVPIPKVSGISEEDMFKVINTGKRKNKGWKRMVTMPTFVYVTRSPLLMELGDRSSDDGGKHGWD